jgi:hypothetical protein
MNAVPALGNQRSGRSLRAFLVAFSGLLLLTLGGCIYFFSQRPQLTQKPPVGIDLRFGEYRASITDRTLCKAIVNELGHARRVLTVSQFGGRLGIQYDDGTSQQLFMTVHGSTFWIGGRQVFAGDAERLLTLLKQGGADVTRISG